MRRSSLGLVVAFAFACAAACSDQKLATPTVANVPTDGGGGPATSIDAGTKRPGILRIATFNVRRFFDTVCDTGRCASGDFEAVLSQATFDATADRLAKGIALIDPDVIALQEVETEGCLDALKIRLMAAGLDFPIAHLGETGSPGSVDVGILARGTLTQIKTHRETPLKRPDGSRTTFTRELLEVRMTFGARPVVMFAAHFRSQVDDDPGRRLAEANATRDIIAATATELPDALVVLGGDLNDRPGSAVLDAVEANASLLRVAKDIVPESEQGTFLFNGTRSALDHIFVVSGQATRYVPKTAAVYRDDTRGFAGSDHASLAADFSIE